MHIMCADRCCWYQRSNTQNFGDALLSEKLVPDGVDLNRAGKLLGMIMNAVLGGVWHTSVAKWSHVHGTANEVYAAMIEDTLAVAWCHVPAVVQVFSDNKCKAFAIGRR